jgi:hypothetical protein
MGELVIGHPRQYTPNPQNHLPIPTCESLILDSTILAVKRARSTSIPPFLPFKRPTRIHRLSSIYRLCGVNGLTRLVPTPVVAFLNSRDLSSTMASFMRPTILRQAAMSRAAFAQPAVRSNFIRAAAMHTTSKRPAILPPGPRKLIRIGDVTCTLTGTSLLTCWIFSSRAHRGWRYDSHQYIATKTWNTCRAFRDPIANILLVF